MIQFKTLVLDTLKREYKNKFLYFLTFLSIIILLALNYGLEIFLRSFKDSASIINIGQRSLEIYYYFINSWSFVLAVVLGSQIIRTDFSLKMIGQILSFDIKRSTYLYARLVGGWLIVFIYYLLFFIIATITISFHLDTFELHFGLILAFILSSLLNFFVILMSVFLSLYLNKIATTMTMFLFIAVISYSNVAFSTQGFSFYQTDFINQFFYILFPHLGLINKWASVYIFSSEIKAFPFLDLIHFFITTGVWATAFSLTFRKRDIT